jgi:hypothetical protein
MLSGPTSVHLGPAWALPAQTGRLYLPGRRWKAGTTRPRQAGGKKSPCGLYNYSYPGPDPAEAPSYLLQPPPRDSGAWEGKGLQRAPFQKEETVLFGPFRDWRGQVSSE